MQDRGGRTTAHTSPRRIRTSMAHTASTATSTPNRRRAPTAIRPAPRPGRTTVRTSHLRHRAKTNVRPERGATWVGHTRSRTEPGRRRHCVIGPPRGWPKTACRQPNGPLPRVCPFQTRGRERSVRSGRDWSSHAHCLASALARFLNVGADRPTGISLPLPPTNSRVALMSEPAGVSSHPARATN